MKCVPRLLCRISLRLRELRRVVQYFASRPELLSSSVASTSAAPATSTSSAASAAMSAAAPVLATAALRNPSFASSALRSQGASPKFADAVGRFGATHADALGPAVAASAIGKAPPPPPPTVNARSSASSRSPTAGPAGLTTGKSWGSMSTNSKSAARP